VQVFHHDRHRTCRLPSGDGIEQLEAGREPVRARDRRELLGHIERRVAPELVGRGRMDGEVGGEPRDCGARQRGLALARVGLDPHDRGPLHARGVGATRDRCEFGVSPHER
jgi:hypothetical protein